MITKEQLLGIMPTCGARAARFLDPINAAMDEFGIDTVLRQGAFLAQLAHESGEFRYMRELADGSAYEDRTDLGNVEPGDGKRFKGRGPIQITGRRNYTAAGNALQLDLLAEPELLEQPVHGCRSAGWFWRVGAGLNLGRRAIAHGIPVGIDLNDLADPMDFEAITIAINGGLNGWEDRNRYYARAQAVLSA